MKLLQNVRHHVFETQFTYGVLRIRGFAFMRYINSRLIDWLTDWLIDWLIDCVSDI